MTNDSKIFVFTGSSLADLKRDRGGTSSPYDAPLDCGQNDSHGAWELIDATAGTTYRIAVDGYGGATGSVKLSWSQP